MDPEDMFTNDRLRRVLVRDDRNAKGIRSFRGNEGSASSSLFQS